MKRMAVLLMALALCSVSSALAAFDLKPYLYADEAVYPVDAETMLVINRGEDAHEIELRSGGSVTCSVSIPRQDDFLSPFTRSDGRIGFIIMPEFGYIDVDRRFFLMDRTGAMTKTYDLNDDVRYLDPCADGFSGLIRTEDGQRLVVMDEIGQTLFTRDYAALEEERLGMLGCVRDSDGTYFAAVSGEVMPTDGARRIILTHLDARGNVLWETEFEAKYSYDAAVLAGDGRGGAYLVKTDDENYKLLQAYRFDEEGSMLWAKRIEAQGLILSAIVGSVDPKSGNLIVDGNAISKSKGVYKPVKYTISGQGEILSVEARDFSSRPDYGFNLYRAQDGAIFAMSRANYPGSKKNTKLAAVPVDALPETGAPVIRAY